VNAEFTFSIYDDMYIRPQKRRYGTKRPKLWRNRHRELRNVQTRVGACPKITVWGVMAQNALSDVLFILLLLLLLFSPFNHRIRSLAILTVMQVLENSYNCPIST